MVQAPSDKVSVRRYKKPLTKEAYEMEPAYACFSGQLVDRYFLRKVVVHEINDSRQSTICEIVANISGEILVFECPAYQKNVYCE